MISKLLRYIDFQIGMLASWKRKIRLKMLYPGITLTGSRIQKNCMINCDNNAKLVLINSTIMQGCMIRSHHGGTLIIKDSFIGKGSVIVCSDHIKIDSHCLIAEMSVIRDTEHNMIEKDGDFYGNMGNNSAPIHIEENVWIGTKATVLKGVTIKKNGVIGANAVVTKSTEESCVYVGIPAKKLKSIITENA